MKKVRVVIGAGLGDEGKGRITHEYSKTADLVVRFNGGSQAAHNVVDNNGCHFCFGHLGSGSLWNVPTYLANKFVVNPSIFKKEHLAFSTHYGKPKIYVHAGCLVTTPFDMALNKMFEEDRGDARHGSCGIGFNETIERSLWGGIITTDDLKYKRTLEQQAHAILNRWVPVRFDKEIPEHWNNILQNPQLMKDWLDACKYFLQNVTIIDNRILGEFDNVLFEGAQGLQLDQNHDWFPHVTRSNTGIHNVLEIIPEDILLDVTYVTRAYATRHGAGPFPYATTDDEYKIDKSHEHNSFNGEQGVFRYGKLDIYSLRQSISTDISLMNGRDTSFTLAVTCIDQVEEVQLVDEDIHKLMTPGHFLWYIHNYMNQGDLDFNMVVSDAPSGDLDYSYLLTK